MIGQQSKSSKETRRGKKKKKTLCTAREDPKFHLCKLYFPKPRFKTVRTVQFQIHTQYNSACRCCSSALQADKWWAVFRAVCFFLADSSKVKHTSRVYHILHPIDYFTTLQCFMSIGVCVGGVCKCPVFVSWLQHRTTTLGWILLQSKSPSKRKATEMRQTKEDKVIGKEWRGKINGEKSSHFTVKANPEDISELGARK